MSENAFDFEGLLDAMERRDVDAFAGYFRDDVTFHVEALREPIRGRDVLRSLGERGFAVLEDFEVEPESLLQQGDRLALLLRVSGRFSEDVTYPGVGTLPTRGKRFDTRVALFAVVDEEDRVATMTRVRDTWQVMRQLGISAERMDALLRGFEKAYAS